MNRYLEKRMKQKDMDGHNYRGMGGHRMSQREMNMPLGYDRNNGDMRRGRDRDYNDGYDAGYNDGRRDYAQDMRRGRRRDRRSDYNDYNDYNDYGNYEDYAAKGGEEEYHKDLKTWIDKMKSKDRFKIPYDKLIEQAKNMGVRFDDYSELEFYATYLAMITDYRTVSGEYSLYLKMAKEFLEDDDAELKGSDKICAYLYTIVMGE